MKVRTIIGLILSAIWISFWVFYVSKNYISFDGMTLNEKGDFIAGISSALAFIWLVIGYYQQGEELSQNTGALKEHEISLKKQAEALIELAAATKMQAEITVKKSEEYSRSIQPVFQIHSNDFEHGADVHIINIGSNEIYDFEVSLLSKLHRLPIPIDRWPKFYRDSSLSFHVANSDNQSRVTEPIELKFSYRDSNFEQQTVYIKGLNRSFSQKWVKKA